MKKILLVLMVILLNLSLVFASDSLSVSLVYTNEDDYGATLVATARDVGDEENGVAWVGIYRENGYLEGERTNCDGVTCVYYKDVVFPTDESQVSYYAKTKDITIPPHTKTSDIITFYLAPIIVTGPNEVNIEKTSIRIEWITDINSYGKVRYGLSPGNYVDYEDDINFDTNHGVDLINLIEGETYYYVVESTVDGKTGISDEGNFVPRDIDAPIISNVNSVVSETPLEATVTWNTNINSDGRVKYGTTSGYYPNFLDDVVIGTTHSVTLTGISDDTTYYYKVESSVDISGVIHTGKSGEETFITPDLTAPEITGIREDDIYLTSTRIKWNTDEPATSKVLYDTVSRALPDEYEFSEALTGYETSHDILLDNLEDGVTYYYVVESEDEDGNIRISSPESNFVTGKIVITFREPDDGDEFYVGDRIEGELRIENRGSDELEVDVKIVLYDETEDDEIDEVDFENKDIDAGDDMDFNFEFDLPFNLDSGNNYMIYAEVDVDGTTYRQEINLDVDRKANDVRVENMRVYVSGDKLEVALDVVNYGKKDKDDVYIEVTVFGLGLSKVSDTFSLEDWEGDNREFKKFIFSLDDVEDGIYTVEAALYYDGSHEYISKDFEIKRVSDGEVKLIESGLKSGFIEEEPSFDAVVMKNVTWGIVDFLLLVVVIYGFVWLIKNR